MVGGGSRLSSETSSLSSSSFGEGGGQKIAAEYEAELLGSLPLALKIRQQTDEGNDT